MVIYSMMQEARIYNKQKTASLINGVGKTTATCKKNHIGLLPHTMYKNKWIKELDVRSETICLLKENIGSMLL